MGWLAYHPYSVTGNMGREEVLYFTMLIGVIVTCKTDL